MNIRYASVVFLQGLRIHHTYNNLQDDQLSALLLAWMSTLSLVRRIEIHASVDPC
jgi:hypothetical protein